MAESGDDRAQPAEPADPAVRRGRLRPSFIWVVPIIALVAAVTLGARAWIAAGPNIAITFHTAEGLEAGRTEVRYKEVVVGRVERVELDEDHQRVVASVVLEPQRGRSRSRRFAVLGRAAPRGRHGRHGPRHDPVGRLHRHGRRRVNGAPPPLRRSGGAALLPARRAGPAVRAVGAASRLAGARLAGVLPAHARGPRRGLRARPDARRRQRADIRRGAQRPARDGRLALLGSQRRGHLARRGRARRSTASRSRR